MKITRTCGECGIPIGIARTLDWNSDGTITQKKDPRHRMIFFESENLDRLWSRLAGLLGLTQEHLWDVVIESKSKATRAFLYRTLPWHVNLLAHFIGYKTIISAIQAQGLVMGYGKITIGGQSPARGRPERITVVVEDPYSLPYFCGDFKGAAEVTERRPAEITYQALDYVRHQIDVTMGKERLEEEQFIWKEEVPRKAGDIVYNRCSTCGSPLELKQFKWDLNTGIIKETETGRRMALFGTTSLMAVFDEMTRELGKRVLEYIIDVQRENTIAAMSVDEVRSGYEGLRFMAAIRGLGLLAKLQMDANGMNAVMSNPSVPAYIVALALGIFELDNERRGKYEWKIGDDGDLTIDITPA
jgi:hypothetical protein